MDAVKSITFWTYEVECGTSRSLRHFKDIHKAINYANGNDLEDENFKFVFDPHETHYSYEKEAFWEYSIYLNHTED